jgi:glycosyltransferase involved in cell wall biosynthesis
VHEVVVIDSGSTDRTCDIAAAMGARVILNEWPGFSAQKQFGTDAARHEWILSLDADERVSPELRDEIVGMIGSPPTADGYRVPRLSTYLGRPIRHGGWYPDRQLRLFDRRKGRWNGRVVHESVAMTEGAQVGSLTGNILHRTVDTAEEHARMIEERYAPLAAEQMRLEGRKTSIARAYASGGISFLRSYLFRLGFLDGLPGFWIAYFAGKHNFRKHRLLASMPAEPAGEVDGPVPTTKP